MIPSITAFERSPDRGKGLARDMRVRWALEEVGQPYDVRLLSFSEMKEPAHRSLHPFGQIPTYEEGDLVLFESAAIVFHIAECHAGLLPEEANARTRAITWMFAALNTVEPPIVDREIARLVEREEAWYERRLSIVEDRICDRLGKLSSRLGNGRLARRRVQRWRPSDGVDAAALEWIAYTGRISEPLRLCRPQQSVASLQACFRCSVGGFHCRNDSLMSAAFRERDCE